MEISEEAIITIVFGFILIVGVAILLVHVYEVTSKEMPENSSLADSQENVIENAGCAINTSLIFPGVALMIIGILGLICLYVDSQGG